MIATRATSTLARSVWAFFSQLQLLNAKPRPVAYLDRLAAKETEESASYFQPHYLHERAKAAPLGKMCGLSRIVRRYHLPSFGAAFKLGRLCHTVPEDYSSMLTPIG